MNVPNIVNAVVSFAPAVYVANTNPEDFAQANEEQANYIVGVAHNAKLNITSVQLVMRVTSANEEYNFPIFNYKCANTKSATQLLKYVCEKFNAFEVAAGLTQLEVYKAYNTYFKRIHALLEEHNYA